MPKTQTTQLRKRPPAPVIIVLIDRKPYIANPALATHASALRFVMALSMALQILQFFVWESNRSSRILRLSSLKLFFRKGSPFGSFGPPPPILPSSHLISSKRMVPGTNAFRNAMGETVIDYFWFEQETSHSIKSHTPTTHPSIAFWFAPSKSCNSNIA